MAESVTRHALISDTDNIEYLTCGIDSLDVGFMFHGVTIGKSCCPYSIFAKKTHKEQKGT